MQDLRDKRVTVAGLGRFGGQIAAARWLVGQGAKVLVTDRASDDTLADSLLQLRGLDIEFRLGTQRLGDFTGADLIVASPAIPPSNEYLAAARNAGVPVTTEIWLFIERCPATIVGVTGTKGKSTATALLGEMLKTLFTTHVGGNIGKSLLPELQKIDKTDIVILELSSYMLHYLGAMRWSPHMAVVTLLAADHIEWHGSVEAYRAAKANIVRFQRPDDFAVLNARDPLGMELASLTPARIARFGEDGFRPLELALCGEHNQMNAQAAMTAVQVIGVSWESAQAAVRAFPGLPHRLQLIHECDGVRYYNDSIATIPESAIAVLRIVSVQARDPDRGRV